jgi:hypothetical protein
MSKPSAAQMKKNKILKIYKGRHFCLTERKYARVIEIAKERIEKIASGSSVTERFEVTFAGTRDISLNTITDVFALDNSVKNPITRLRFIANVQLAEEESNSISIDFNGGDSDSGATIAAVSDNLSWLQETLGALEEQVDRTVQSEFFARFNSPQAIVQFFMAFAMALFLTSMMYSTLITDADGGIGLRALGMNISSAEAKELIAASNTIKTDSEKLDFIYQVIKKTLEPKAAKPNAFRKYISEPKYWLIGLPILVALIAAIVALLNFYPSYVFAWGDVKEHYEKILERRKFVWYGVIASLVIGVLGNFFVLGLTTTSP